MSARFNRKTKEWLPKPGRFWQLFGSNPERLRNMHFAFVVMLRAVKRATPSLYSFNISVGDKTEDERSRVLLRWLLDSAILKECSSVFNAFDENTLFHRSGPERRILQQQFKHVFQNISMALDCVACQKCRLHAKLHLLGLGTALKILLTPQRLQPKLVFTREEIVALINTVAKFSSAIKHAGELTEMYWSEKREEKIAFDRARGVGSESSPITNPKRSDAPHFDDYANKMPPSAPSQRVTEPTATTVPTFVTSDTSLDAAVEVRVTHFCTAC